MILPVGAVPELRDGDLQPLRDHAVTARDLKLMAFHPLGTARMAERAADGVLDADGAPHGTTNFTSATAAPSRPRWASTPS